MKLKTFILIAVVTTLLFACNKTAENTTELLTTPQNLTDSMSYSLGYNIGKNIIKPFMEDSIALNVDMVALGIKHSASTDTTLALLSNEMLDSLTKQIQMQAQAKQEKKMQEKQQKFEELSKSAKEDGKKFLEENKSKPGIISDNKGFQYRIIKEGKGLKPKTDEDIIKFHLVATFTDGSEIQSTKQSSPIEIPLGYGTPIMKELFKKISAGSI